MYTYTKETKQRMLMKMQQIRAYFENFEVIFSLGSAETGYFRTTDIDQLAYEILKEEGADCLLSEVEWEIV
jgi:hypothetical protein